MPKPRQRVATGMSLQDVLSMPVSKLESYTPAQQRELVSRVGSAVNKRYKNLTSAGVMNSATVRLEQSGGKISVRGKSGQDLKNELIRAREFLKNPYSSKKDWNKAVKEAEKGARKYSQYLDDNGNVKIGETFAFYDTIRELTPEIVDEVNKYDVRDEIERLMQEDKSPAEIIQGGLDFIKRRYEEQQQEYKSTSRRFSEGLKYDDIPARAQNKRKRKRKRK